MRVGQATIDETISREKEERCVNGRGGEEGAGGRERRKLQLVLESVSAPPSYYSVITRGSRRRRTAPHRPFTTAKRYQKLRYIRLSQLVQVSQRHESSRCRSAPSQALVTDSQRVLLNSSTERTLKQKDLQFPKITPFSVLIFGTNTAVEFQNRPKHLKS